MRWNKRPIFLLAQGFETQAFWSPIQGIGK